MLSGLLLWVMPLGDYWINASFDYQLRFGSRAVSNKVVLILMDNAAFDQFHQTRGQPWDRELHARLLNRLADDGCPLVVVDSFFREPRDSAKDEALAAAMRRQRRIVLMAEQSQIIHPALDGVQPTLPFREFLNASGTNWGVAWLDPDLDSIVRRQWPFPSPGPYPSLSWSAARALGATFSQEPQERWLRYYGQNGAWTKMSYGYALAQPAGYFRDKIIFIGSHPKTTLADDEVDKFRTPYTRWTGEATGGVEILATLFLNLLNNESLLRPVWWVELLLLATTGITVGGGLCRLRMKTAVSVTVGTLLLVSFSGVLLSHYSNYWFPWLIIAGGQLPCALAWTAVVRMRSEQTSVKSATVETPPETPGYELIHPPFGEGAYGKVWLARSKAGQWRALKAVYLAKFNNNSGPYEREYEGIRKYMPLSDKHPGLLHVDFVSQKGDEYFYYVMELGDSIVSGWQHEPASYKPRDLDNERARLPGRRLPVKECVRIGIGLCEALDFIHRQGMTHRDIKPQNIIFVNAEPKLADLGLITNIRPSGEEATLVGTPGYIPPPPDQPGTVSADIYALGVVLYVLSTGRAPALFPEMATTVVNSEDPSEFLGLNGVILNACEPLPENRYASAAKMRSALEELQR